jgi:guanine deaminase
VVTVLRGSVCWPLSPTEAVYLPDGVVAPELPAPREATRGDPAAVDGLIVPGFGDWHFHWVQMDIAGLGSESLLDWLEHTTWPQEMRFADPEFCREEAPRAASRLHRVGTLAGSAYASPHGTSSSAFLEATPASFLCGPATMTSGGPPRLRRRLADAIEDVESLARRFGSRVVVAPRFALSCDEQALAALGDLARRRGLPVQTHLAETREEVAAVRRAFPTARDYTDVYERAGLLGPRTLLGHGILLSDDELRRIALSGAAIVHCPASNVALGSGRLPLDRLRRNGVRWLLGTDVGAAPSLSMLDTIATALEVHGSLVSATELFHRATLGTEAVLAGRTEDRLRPSERPGALVFPRPRTVGASARDPETWLRALVAEHSAESGAPRRFVPWGLSLDRGHGVTR